MGQTINVSVDDQGHVVIPAELTKRLGLAPGMTLVVEKEETGGVRLQVQPESPVLIDERGIKL